MRTTIKTITEREVPYYWGLGPWKLQGFQMLSHAIWALVWSMLIQSRIQKNRVNQNLEEARACCAPLWIRHWNRPVRAAQSDFPEKEWNVHSKTVVLKLHHRC